MARPISVFIGCRCYPPGGSLVQLMLTAVPEAGAGVLALIPPQWRPLLDLAFYLIAL